MRGLPQQIHGLGVPDCWVVLFICFICRDNCGYKSTGADLLTVSMHKVRMEVLLSDHKMVFVFAGVVAIQGSAREMMRDLCS